MSAQHHLDATTQTWKRPNEPQHFLLTYNRRKLPTRNPITRREYEQNLSLWATEYPATVDFQSCIILQNGVFFNSMDELRDHFKAMGDYTLGDEESEAQP